MILDPASGEVTGKEIAAAMRPRPPSIAPLDRNAREASWLLSLGVEIEGELLDLVPLLANLLRRESRWLDAARAAAVPDEEMVRLRAPGGRRIDAPAARLKPVIACMLDLLADPRRAEGPLPLSEWDAQRFDQMCRSLLDTQRERAGPHGGWQLQGDAGLRQLARRLADAGTPPAVAAPEGLGITLRPYQLHGVAWLQYLRAQHLGGILADDMGLGKTAQALAHLLVEKQAGRLDRPALVVLPSSLVFNWEAEARRIAPSLRVLALQGAGRAADYRLMAGHDLVLTTYALLWRDIEVLRAQPFHLLILDEAQSVKNPAGRTARAVRRLDARHRLCLTGTPLENNLGELWAQFDFLMPGFLGDARTFKRVWRTPIEVNGQSQRARLLAQRIRPFVLRRRKDEVAAELPPRTEVIKWVQLEGEQRERYESVRVAADEEIRRILRHKGFDGALISILDALLKLRQVCCDPRLLKTAAPPPDAGSAKMALLRHMLPALMAEGRRILVFSQFTGMLALIESELRMLDMPFLSFTGDTPVAARAGVVQAFQGGTVPLMLVSLKAGGVGLNLTAADTVVHVDPWWNPAVEEQATARAHRIGQDRPVFVYKLLVEGSIEERILALQARKSALAEGVLGSDAGMAAKFGPEDLQLLLAPLG
ncbi:MAG TPA: DEAD/DEAH box helicase [Noviherbaspirillum sp.]|jgi:SNF2 family DNA or RNA helicase|uniref:DEAD/DEAH box helicase n=1 Tax=Noviherbaspirillum sp. TaxID=1926288 RepID=UPI002F95DF82